MKETLALLTRYNTAVNAKLYDLLAKQPAEILRRESGAFFHTVLGVLNHILRSDINGLLRIRNALPAARMLEDPGLEIPASPPRGALLHDELHPLRNHRVAVDRLYEAFIDGMEEPVFSTAILFRSMAGVDMHTTVGHHLLHLFNHATHHRGAISQILDAAKVENDYSSLSSVIDA